MVPRLRSNTCIHIHSNWANTSSDIIFHWNEKLYIFLLMPCVLPRLRGHPELTSNLTTPDQSNLVVVETQHCRRKCPLIRPKSNHSPDFCATMVQTISRLLFRQFFRQFSLEWTSDQTKDATDQTIFYTLSCAVQIFSRALCRRLCAPINFWSDHPQTKVTPDNTTVRSI